MPTSLRISVDLSKVEAKYGKAKTDAAMKQALASTVEFAAGRMRTRVPVVTGFLRSSISGQVIATNKGKIFAAQKGGVYYAPFVDQGTGVYAAGGSPIRPKQAKVLSWHGPNGQIFARSVRGQKGVHFVKKTITQDKNEIAGHFKTNFLRSLTG